MAVCLSLKHTSRSYKPSVKLRALKRFTFFFYAYGIYARVDQFPSDILVTIMRVIRSLRAHSCTLFG